MWQTIALLIVSIHSKIYGEKIPEPNGVTRSDEFAEFVKFVEGEKSLETIIKEILSVFLENGAMIINKFMFLGPPKRGANFIFGSKGL